MADDADIVVAKMGRPRKSAGPKVPYDEIDRLLVHGEVVEAEAGGTTLVYPSYRNLAARYGCAHSLIAQYSRKHDCMRRRKHTKARVVAKAEQKLVEMRANAMAVSKDDALQIIDAYLAGFGEAIAEGRIRFDNPTDFNTMMRLKEFVLGGPDSRQEIHAALSLEDIQARHQRMLRVTHQVSAEERGVIDALPAAEADESGRVLSEDAPAPPAAPGPEDVRGQFSASAEAEPVSPTSRALNAADDQADGGERAPHGANVALTGPSTSTPANVALTGPSTSTPANGGGS